MPRFICENNNNDIEVKNNFDTESYNDLINILSLISDRAESWKESLQHRFKRSGFKSKDAFIKIISREISIDENELIDKLSNNNVDIDSLYLLYVNSNLHSIIRHIDHFVMLNFRNIRYVAPLRASAERFYRFQDYNVNELDSEGKNLAMLLSSLSEENMLSFQAWTKENFDFEVFIKEEGMHYQIMINNDGDHTNIHDMGFGFSQILPIMASLWYESNNKSNQIGFGYLRHRNDRIIAIEQPELHLHPELQAKLAKVIAKLVFKMKNKGVSFKVIFETHSKTMINALGDLVEENPEYKEIINIVIFDKENEYTKVESVSFDEDGDLINWPVGFFSGR